jgi:GlpG protein
MWYFRLFSNTLGHADGNHLMNNLAFILLLGPIVEEKYGGKNMLIMLLTTAFVSSIIHIIFSNAGLLGASGIVFMLILISSLVNFKSGEIPLTFILVVVIYIGKELIGIFQDDNVSHTTHIIGGIIGAIFGFMSRKSGTTKKNSIKKSNPMSAIR